MKTNQRPAPLPVKEVKFEKPSMAVLGRLQNLLNNWEVQPPENTKNWDSGDHKLHKLRCGIEGIMYGRCLHDGERIFNKERSGFEWHIYNCAICNEEIWVAD